MLRLKVIALLTYYRLQKMFRFQTIGLCSESTFGFLEFEAKRPKMRIDFVCVANRLRVAAKRLVATCSETTGYRLKVVTYQSINKLGWLPCDRKVLLVPIYVSH